MLEGDASDFYPHVNCCNPSGCNDLRARARARVRDLPSKHHVLYELSGFPRGLVLPSPATKHQSSQLRHPARDLHSLRKLPSPSNLRALVVVARFFPSHPSPNDLYLSANPVLIRTLGSEAKLCLTDSK
eukprot:gene24292-9893_t